MSRIVTQEPVAKELLMRLGQHRDQISAAQKYRAELVVNCNWDNPLPTALELHSRAQDALRAQSIESHQQNIKDIIGSLKALGITVSVDDYWPYQ